MRINFDLEDLEAFLAVKETGSFHLAADRLALSQSAVTRRIQKLEAALDSVLFERTTRKVKPTLAAKRLQARAEAILEDARETARSMRDESVAFAHQRSMVVTLAIIPTIIPEALPAALNAFRAAGHTARVRILDFAANEIADAVSEGEADFGVSSMPALDPNLTFETLFEDKMVAVLPTGHSLVTKDAELRWQDLGETDLILPARRTGNRVLIDDALARARNELKWTFETQRSSTALSLVAGGAGVAILPLSAVRKLGDPRVIWRALREPEILRPIGLLQREGSQLTAEAAGLESALRGVLA